MYQATRADTTRNPCRALPHVPLKLASECHLRPYLEQMLCHVQEGVHAVILWGQAPQSCSCTVTAHTESQPPVQRQQAECCRHMFTPWKVCPCVNVSSRIEPLAPSHHHFAVYAYPAGLQIQLCTMLQYPCTLNGTAETHLRQWAGAVSAAAGLSPCAVHQLLELSSPPQQPAPQRGVAVAAAAACQKVWAMTCPSCPGCG